MERDCVPAPSIIDPWFSFLEIDHLQNPGVLIVVGIEIQVEGQPQPG